MEPTRKVYVSDHLGLCDDIPSPRQDYLKEESCSIPFYVFSHRFAGIRAHYYKREGCFYREFDDFVVGLYLDNVGPVHFGVRDFFYFKKGLNERADISKN